MRDGFRLFSKHPLPFSLMLVVFRAAAGMGSAIPAVGNFLMLCAVPVLGLGFMIASEAALNKGPIHPGQFLTAFKAGAPQMRAQLILCAAFGLSTLAVLWLAHTVDGGAFARLQQMMAEQAPPDQIDELLADGAFQQGLFIRFGLAALASAIFWHAPALVHWGHQSAAQALFSSTLAMWRNKGAFVVYMLSWLALIAVFGIFAALAFSLLGMRQMASLVALPAGLIFSTVFYVSLLFTFNDCFGNHGLKSAEA
mgnify:CR=1 FL=1